MKSLLYFLLILSFSQICYAIREPRSTAVDSRLKVITYSPDDVFKFTGFYGYQSNIEFASDEEILTISMGDTTSWQMVPNGSRLFIKPMEKDATTNMTIISNKRVYFFELYAEEAADMRDPDLVFNLKFLYPDDEASGDSLKRYTTTKNTSVDLEHPERYNFNYYISGDSSIAPVKIFDDGEFTYFQFRDKNADMPAFFIVDEYLKESVVNYRLSADTKYIIVEQVAAKFTIRFGEKIVCVYNDSIKKRTKKSWW